MMDQGALRNLEQIQETDTAPTTPKGMAFALLVLGGACVVFATLALTGHKTQPQVKIDPLGDLVASRAHPAAGAKPTDLTAHDVTFPGILSDADHPTTALAAVRANVTAPLTPAAVDSAPLPVLVPVAPPPAGDKLPVVALPAQNVLNASPVLTRPRDSLTLAATDSAQVNVAGAPAAAAGHDGGYQLQVSSFRSQAEAN
jgi:DedD protein